MSEFEKWRRGGNLVNVKETFYWGVSMELNERGRIVNYDNLQTNEEKTTSKKG